VESASGRDDAAASFDERELQNGDKEIPAWSASASKDAANRVHLTLCHTGANGSGTIEIDLRGVSAQSVSGRVLAAENLNTHNTFENPEALAPRELTGDELRMENGRLTLTLPAASVAVVTVEA
jgi:alpha-N-arabinofuranosidase